MAIWRLHKKLAALLAASKIVRSQQLDNYEFQTRGGTVVGSIALPAQVQLWHVLLRIGELPFEPVMWIVTSSQSKSFFCDNFDPNKNTSLIKEPVGSERFKM